MTTPGGGGGFEVGSDFVAARVSFDVDPSGVTTLKELTEQLKNFRTEVEAQGRGSENFIKYLQQITEAAKQATQAQAQFVAQLQKMSEMQQSMLTGQGSNVVRGLPQGSIDPYLGTGMSGGAAQGARMPAGATGGYPATPLGAQGYLSGMAQADPRQYMNWQAQRGNFRPGDAPAASPSDQDLEQHAQRHARREEEQVRRNQRRGSGEDPYEMMERRTSQLASGAGQLINELSPGGTPIGMMSLAQRSMSGLGGMMRGAGMGGMGGMIGAGAGILGAGAAGMYAVQQGGEVLQDYRNMGSIKGGGISEGFGYQMAIQSMALNPFITTDQARQIVSAGLSSGHTGKEFDTLTQFMAQNLKELNMSAAESMQLFKKNVYEGGMSEESMATTMQMLKGMAGQSGSLMTTPELVANYGASTSAFMAGGMSGPAANATAMQALQMFPNVEALKDVMPQLAQSASTNPQTAAVLRTFGGFQVPGSTSPGGVTEALGDNLNPAILNTLTRYAKQFYNGSQDKTWAVDQFQRFGARMFPGMAFWNDRDKVKQFMMKLLQGNTAEFTSKADKRNEELLNQSVSVNERPLAGRLIQDVGMAIGDIGAGIGDLVAGAFNSNHKDKFQNSWEDNWERATSRTHIPAMDAVMQQNGGQRNIEVGSGNNWQTFNPTNEAQVRALSSGQMKWRRKGEGGEGMTLRETPQDSSASNASRVDTGPLDAKGGGGRGGGGQQQPVQVSGEVRIVIDQEGRARAATDRVPLTANQQAAMQGSGRAQMNNPPPGDTPGLNGYERK